MLVNIGSVGLSVNLSFLGVFNGALCDCFNASRTLGIPDCLVAMLGASLWGETSPRVHLSAPWPVFNRALAESFPVPGEEPGRGGDLTSHGSGSKFPKVTAKVCWDTPIGAPRAGRECREEL